MYADELDRHGTFCGKNFGGMLGGLLPGGLGFLLGDGKLNYGSSGIGTSSQLSVVMLELATGTHMTHVPFRSTTDEITSMMSGNVDVAIDSMTTLWPQAQAGSIRALAVTSAHRLASAPDLPTIGETLPGYEATAWQGLYAPAGTPRAIIDRLAAEARRILARPDVAEALITVGAEPAPGWSR